MKNQSVSDFVAASMDAVLKSKEHRDLFATQYRRAGAEHCEKCEKSKDQCSCDSSAADDNEARKKKEKEDKEKSSSSDSSSAWDDNDARKKKEDSSSADDNEAKKKKFNFEKSDESSADDNEARKKKEEDSSSADDLQPSVAFDVAIDSLLTASAALDSLGLDRGSSFALKIASFVVNAKKKEKESKKSKKDSKSD